MKWYDDIICLVFFFLVKPSSSRGEASTHINSLTLLFFIEVSVPSNKSEWSCICKLEVSIVYL